MLYAVLVTIFLIILGFVVAMYRTGTMSSKINNQVKKHVDWTKAKHVWEISPKKGIYYCNVLFSFTFSVY